MNPRWKVFEFGDQRAKPRILMLTIASEEIRELAEMTVYQNKVEYARRWKHDLIVITEPNPEFRVEDGHSYGLSWDRLREAVNFCKTGRYDWIYCVGADTLITNLTIPLSSFLDDQYHFIIGNDCNEWNADSFFLRCSAEGIAYGDDVLGYFEQFKTHVWVEQRVMIDRRDSHPGICKTLPQRAMNSYNYDLYENRGGRDGKDCAGNDGQWQPGDFLLHWAGINWVIRKSECRRVLPMIVR